MGKGISELQREILAVLEEYPSLEETMTPDTDTLQMRHWGMPGDILARLGRQSTAANRAPISKALLRLCERGLVARGSGELANVGKSFHYARITDSKNDGPVGKQRRKATER